MTVLGGSIFQPMNTIVNHVSEAGFLLFEPFPDLPSGDLLRVARLRVLMSLNRSP